MAPLYRTTIPFCNDECRFLLASLRTSFSGSVFDKKFKFNKRTQATCYLVLNFSTLYTKLPYDKFLVAN